MRRFKSFADLDFSLRFDGVMSTSISKMRGFSGERPSTVARRVGRGLSYEKVEGLVLSDKRLGGISVWATQR